MTLNSTIITAAYRESNYTAQGGSLTAGEQSEGLALLQSITDSFFGLVIGTRLKPWWIPYPNHTSSKTTRYPARTGEVSSDIVRDPTAPPANSRVIMRNSEAMTIYMQYQPEDGSVMQFVDAGFTGTVIVDANGHFIGSSGVATTYTMLSQVGSGSRLPTKTFVFRADIAAWVEIGALEYTQENPFPAMFDDFWTTYLAMRLAPRFGNEPAQVTMLRAKEMIVFIRGWYHQTAETLGNGPQLSEQSFMGGGYNGDPDSGRI